MRKCEGGWIDTYLQYTSQQESPTVFHEWVAVSILGAVLGRSIWIPRIKYVIYPNLYVVLVAGSAKCKKSTSLNIGMDILKSMEKPPMIFAQKITTEALIQALEGAKQHGASSGLVCASEFSVFMGADGTRSGIIPALTDLYDSPREWIYHTRGRGQEVLKNVTLSLLAASTKEWLRTSIPEEAIGGGFTSRIIFVYQERPSRAILFPDESTYSADKILRSNLIYDLNLIKKMTRGEFKFSDEAKQIALDWYLGESGVIRDSKLDGYYARKHDIMFKLAAILAISEGHKTVIMGKHITRALAMMEENEKSLEGVISSVVTTSAGGLTEKVYDMVRKQGKITHSELLRKCWRFANAAEVSMMVRTLVEGEEIDENLGENNKTRFYTIRKKGSR